MYLQKEELAGTCGVTLQPGDAGIAGTVVPDLAEVLVTDRSRERREEEGLLRARALLSPWQAAWFMRLHCFVCLFVCFLFWPHQEARWILLVPRPGIEPGPWQ